MSQFNMIKESNDTVKIMTESLALMNEIRELSSLLDENGEFVCESVSQFVKDGREFIKHGILPHYEKKPEAGKEDENKDGKVSEDDKILYFAKMVGGLMYYIKKDIKANNDGAFKLVVKGLIADKHVDQNVKTMAEKNLQTFIKTVIEKFGEPSIKAQLEKYLDNIESYFSAEAAPAAIPTAPVKESKSTIFDDIVKLGFTDTTEKGMEHYERKFKGDATPEDLHKAFVKQGWEMVTHYKSGGKPFPKYKVYEYPKFGGGSVELHYKGDKVYYISFNFRQSHD